MSVVTVDVIADATGNLVALDAVAVSTGFISLSILLMLFIAVYGVVEPFAKSFAIVTVVTAIVDVGGINVTFVLPFVLDYHHR